MSVTIRHLGTSEATVRYEDSGLLLYFKLLPGRYNVRAEYRGKRQQATIAEGAKGSDQVMYWH